ncbi:DUF1206 domain-containing protein [Cryobacterium psychrophilum]|uniref:DUF1206 domain-containing protein n=2 Tax=Cryobacterium psychrophilum TaxID=41988 RepID=A0A4Y8KTQ6_9MICO|nr:DUF1206 domain-containing protein [Cryobacterium psychrophilum]
MNGLVHILIAAIAIAIARGGGGTADQSGAFGQLSESPGGLFVLWTVVVGMSALGLWLVLGAFLMKSADPKRKWSHRVIEVSKAAVYLVFAGTAANFASGGTSDSASSTRDASAGLMGAPGGVVVIVAVGLIVLAIGGYFVWKGLLKKFTDDISVPRGSTGDAIIVLGVVGHVAKGIALGVVGILVLVAGFTLDPSKSTGLDGALKSLTALPYGGVILAAIAIGLIAYGAYCFARAWRARLF